MNKACECELSWLDNATICAEFEQAPADDLDDCCKHCRHSESCHATTLIRPDNG